MIRTDNVSTAELRAGEQRLDAFYYAGGGRAARQRIERAGIPLQRLDEVGSADGDVATDAAVVIPDEAGEDVASGRHNQADRGDERRKQSERRDIASGQPIFGALRPERLIDQPDNLAKIAGEVKRTHHAGRRAGPFHYR